MSLDCQQNVESPCIRNCCLNQEDICVGCLRTLEEILQWGTANDHQKLQILNAIDIRKREWSPGSQ